MKKQSDLTFYRRRAGQMIASACREGGNFNSPLLEKAKSMCKQNADSSWNVKELREALVSVLRYLHEGTWAKLDTEGEVAAKAWADKEIAKYAQEAESSS